MLWNLAPALHRTIRYSALPLCCLLFSGLLRAQMPAGTPTYNVNAKWVTDRGSQVYNVKAYGAKCDGVTDDSAAFTAAVAALPGGTGYPVLNTVGGGTLFIPPSPTPCNLASARLAITKSNITVHGLGASLLCSVSDDCLTIGTIGGSATAVSGVTIEGLAMEPTANSAGHSAIRDNAQGTLIQDITSVTNFAEYPSYPGFNHFIENDNDQAETVRHVWVNGYYLVCNSTFCGSTLWEPGPVGTNAGITFLSDFNFDPECSGNGIDWQDGNDLHMKGGVIQGFNQYAVRILGGITRKYNAEQVHVEQGNCSNPLGNLGQAALIAMSADVSWFGGQLGAGLPIFPQAGTTGSTNYGYYIVGHASYGNGVTNPIPIGYLTNGNATVNGTNEITTTWNDFQGAACPTCTYDLLRYQATSPRSAPTGTGNWAVFTGQAESSLCSNGVCTFVDNVTSPASYTVVGQAQGYGYVPFLSLWPGAVVLSNASYYGDALSQGGDFINPQIPYGGGAVTVFGQTTSYGADPEPFSPQPVTNVSLFASPPPLIHGISFTMGDPTNSSALTTSEVQYVTVPFACTIQAYNLAIDSGTITVKFWKVATGTAIPTSTNSISTNGVSIASGTAIHSTTLTDFTTTSVAANDIMAAAVTAVSGAKFVNAVLQCQ